MSDSNTINRTIIMSTKVLTPTEIDNHYFMICIYLSYMYQLQQAIYLILITIGQTPNQPVKDFGYFYMLMIYTMYWLRFLQLYFSRLSIVNPTKAKKLISKIAMWLQISKSPSNVDLDNQSIVEDNYLD